MDIANIRPGMLVLEPEAGRGDIAFACIDAGAIVDCYELMQANFDFLASSGRFNSVHHMDFLEATPEPIYDRIVMNPPFLKQADIKHVQHALRFLKPDGQTAASQLWRTSAVVDATTDRNTAPNKAPEAKTATGCDDSTGSSVASASRPLSSDSGRPPRWRCSRPAHSHDEATTPAPSST